jgi:hypothetical protein
MNQDEHKDLPAFIIVSPKDIAARAYEIYLDRGASDGFDREDWVRAEQELKDACRETTLATQQSLPTGNLGGPGWFDDRSASRSTGIRQAGSWVPSSGPRLSD